MTALTIPKFCPACKQTKDCITEFYVRSGCDNPTEPGHYLTECKACMRLRSKNAGLLNPFEPRTPNERAAVEYLAGKGIFAVPGKAVSYSHVDVVALGCVTIEVKTSTLRERGLQRQYVFNATPQQQKRGYLGQIVMLVCNDGRGTVTHHLFDSRDPVFYMDGRVKSGFTVVPGREQAFKHSNSRVVMTERMMKDALDNLSLIHEKAVESLTAYIASGYTSIIRQNAPITMLPDAEIAAIAA